MRGFKRGSSLTDGNLSLSIAPALTPEGVEENPLFFSGELANPLVVSGGLLVLADIAGSRYFKYAPVGQKDPILSAQGDRLRAECFSACNGVYARMDLFQSALEGEIRYGTTNVDIGTDLRKSLLQLRGQDRLKFRIGGDGWRIFHSRQSDDGSALTEMLIQRPVKTAILHQKMKYRFQVEGMQAKAFSARLPPATGKEQAGWLTATKNGVVLKSVKGKNSVYIHGLHRLSALKRIMRHVNAVSFYAPDEAGQMMLEVCMPGANITLGVTAKSYEG